MDIDQWVLAAIAAKAGVYAASFFLVGTALFWMICDRQKKLGFPYGKWIFIASILTIAFSLFRLGVRAGVLIDDGWGGMIDPEMLELAIQGRVGQSTILRGVGVALLLIGLTLPPQRWGLFAIGSLAISISFALVGHATGEPRWALTAIIAVHLLAVSFWVGALAPLSASASRLPIPTAQIAHRFGTIASFVVPILILAGLAFVMLRLGNPLNLTGSAYGWLLLAKLIIVALLLCMAARNKLRLVPQLAASNRGAAQSLQRIIGFEAMLFTAIFVVSAILTTATQLPE